MKRTRNLLLLLFYFVANNLQAQQTLQRLEVSKNGHFFQYIDGTPFFWLGDTAWELFHRLTKEEINTYLENRRSKGFNVIQTVILAEMDGLHVPNKEGEVPFAHLNSLEPNEQYFKLIDWVVEKARKKGMFIALLPTWGDKMMKAWGKGPVIFNEKNAYSYGLFLGKRYGNFANVIWVTGGDRPAFADSLDNRPIWRSMIKGLREGSVNKNLVTYHPSGESSSSDFWKREHVLDFNMLQSGHGRKDIPVWDWIARDYALNPPKPIIDGEPSYEDHPINWKVNNGYFTDYDVRKQVYRSVFSGAAGVTYGHHSVWQFYQKGIQNTAFAKMYWQEALNQPAATQMNLLKQLIETTNANDRQAAQYLILNKQTNPGEYITALMCPKKKHILIYTPTKNSIKIDFSRFKSPLIRVEWFDPSSGKTIKREDTKRQNQMTFTSPGKEHFKDWVLILRYSE